MLSPSLRKSLSTAALRSKSTLAAAAVSLLALGATSTVQAQLHPGGINVGGGYPLSSSAYGEGCHTCDKNQPTLATIWDFNTPGTLSYLPFHWRGARMDIDNRGYVHAADATTSPQYTHSGGVYVFDRSQGTARTIVRNPQDFDQNGGLEITSDGDYVVVSRTASGSEQIVRLTQGGTYTTILTTQQLGYRVQFNYTPRRDVFSGDILVPTVGSNATISNPILSIAHDNTLRSFHASTSGPAPVFGFDQDHRTGDLFYADGARIMRIPQGTQPPVQMAGLPTILPAGATGHGAVFENQVIANPQLIVHIHSYGASGSRSWLCWFDRQANWTVTKTTAYFTSSNQQKVPLFPNIDIFHDRNNYIQPLKTGPRRWSIDLDLPTHAGSSYLLLPTLSGHVPGFQVSGRRVFLNWDAATNVAVQNSLPGVFSQGAGFLDATGRAQGKLDLTAVGLPTGLTFVMHLVVAVTGPSGIVFLTEATPLQIHT